MAVHRSNTYEKRLRAYQNALPYALMSAGMVVLARIQRIFIIFRPRGWATGATVRSLTVSPPYRDASGWWRVKIGPQTSYAKYVEFGRPPGKWPPIENILDWVREKHIAGTYAVVIGKRGPRYKRQGSKKQRDREDRQVAFLIARKIGQEGTDPFPAVLVGFRQSKVEARRVFMRALIQGMADARFK